MNISRILPFLVFGVIASALALGLDRDPKTIPSMLLDQPLPALSLPPLDAAKPRFESASFIGAKPVLINVFGSWCPSCRFEHPFLMRLALDQRFTLLGLDWKDDADNAKKYLADYGNPFAQIGFDYVGRTAIDLGVTGAPETFFVDTKGIVRRRITGPLTEEIWNAEIEPLLKPVETTP